jgi:uncharacterized membrane protein YgcG
MKTIISFLLLFVSITVFAQYGKVKVPPKTNDYVNDYADILSSNEENNLRAICKSIEKQTSSQVAVVITNSLYEGYAIEDYSFELANRWGIGQAYKNNGLLVLVCPNIHESRLEVGSGLEPVLTDIYTKQLQRTHFNPHFREGEFYLGIANLLVEVKDRLIQESKEPDSYQTSPSTVTTPQPLTVEPIKRQERTIQTDEATGDGLLVMLFIFIGLGIFGLIGYLIYRHYADKQTKRELEKNAKKSKAELDAYFSSVKRELQSLGNFLNVDDVLNEVNLNHLMLEEKFKDKLYEDYASIVLEEKSKIQNITTTILSKYSLKTKIERDSDRLDNLTLSAKAEYEPAMDQYKHIAAHYTQTLLSSLVPPTDNIKVFLIGVKDLFVDAKSLLLNNNFNDAESSYKKANDKLNSLKKFAEQVNSINKNIVSAETYLKTAQDKYKKLYREVENAMDNPDVEDSTLQNWDNFKRNKFEIKLETADPISEKSRAEEYLKKMETHKTQAEKDERDEQARRRRIREANSSTTSTINIGSRSSSSSFGGSSRTSFGGGKFSGGGSSNKW